MSLPNTYVIPPIGTKGVFSFKAPFDTVDKIGATEELTVTAVRSLIELVNSDEKPYDTIYTPIGLTITEYKEDLDTNVPIIVLIKTNGDHFYVPADRIKSLPDISGYRYRKVMIGMNLGSLPMDYDLTLLKANLESSVKESTGIVTVATAIPMSAITYVTAAEHNKLKALLENKSSVDLSYKTLYEQQLSLNTTLKTTITSLENELKKHV